jgi:hypothetical protein
MDITNIILRLQFISENTNDTFVSMTLSKVIEKLKVGKIEVVNELPQLPLKNDGSIYFRNGELYYNVGENWFSFPGIGFDTAFAWGLGSNGRLGTNNIISRSSPVTVVGVGDTNWTQVSAGNTHSLGVTDTGIAYAWGSGADGQLGTGTTTTQSSPVTVVGGITDWSQVSGGSRHSLGLTDDGITYAWGLGLNGQLGTGDNIARSSPVTVIGGITNWTQVSAGIAHSLGITDAGIVYAWGLCNNGRLGTDDLINRSSPVTVIGGITNWSQVSAGGDHSLGVTDDGIAYAWGAGGIINGRLGTGDNIARSSPVTLVGGITNWTQVSAGGSHSLGITDDGVAYAWGSSFNGQLGTGDNINRSSPVTVIGGITNWTQVSAGIAHSLGLTDDGVAYAWGPGSAGQLGTGTTTTQSSPVTVIGGITNWTQVSGGSSHSLAIAFDITLTVEV